MGTLYSKNILSNVMSEGKVAEQQNAIRMNPGGKYTRSRSAYTVFTECLQQMYFSLIFIDVILQITVHTWNAVLHDTPIFLVYAYEYIKCYTSVVA